MGAERGISNRGWRVLTAVLTSLAVLSLAGQAWADSWTCYLQADSSAQQWPAQNAQVSNLSDTFGPAPWMPNYHTIQPVAGWDDDSNGQTWNTAISYAPVYFYAAAESKSKGGFESSGSMVLAARARVREEDGNWSNNPTNPLDGSGTWASAYAEARIVFTGWIVGPPGGDPTTLGHLDAGVYMGGLGSSEYGMVGATTVLPVGQMFVLVYETSDWATYPLIEVGPYPGSHADYSLTINDDQVAYGAATMQYDQSSGQTYLTTEGDLQGATFYPWTSRGAHDEWYQAEGVNSLYGGTYATLTLLEGYEFVPLPPLPDTAVFIAVLLGLDEDPEHVTASDRNGDQVVDGLDMQPFVDQLLAP